MPRTCTICAHPDRGKIETAIVSETPYRNIAKQFGISPAAITRHSTEHIAQSIKQSQAAKEEAQALDVVKQLKEINDDARDILKKAKDEDSLELALKAIDRIQRQLELQAKLLGDIDSPQINIIVTPEWIDIRSQIMRTLKAYPDASVATAKVLADLEGAYARLN
jgi:hypothetical protein